MAERAQVRSVEAIDDFRAHLVVYLSKVRPLLDEVSADLRRMQVWMETEGRQLAEREVRRRARDLEEAQQALLSARLSTFREATILEQTAVHSARRALAAAEDRLRRVRTWTREFGPRTDPLARQVGVLDSAVTGDLGGAVPWLTAILRHLEAYADVRPGNGAPPPAPARPDSAAEAPLPGAAEPTHPTTEAASEAAPPSSATSTEGPP